MNLISEQALGELWRGLVQLTVSYSVAPHWHFNGLYPYRHRTLAIKPRANGLTRLLGGRLLSNTYLDVNILVVLYMEMFLSESDYN